MARTVAQTTFAFWLREELDQRNWGVRTLARKMNPAVPEIPRRALNRYLYEGAHPGSANREALAVALGVKPEEIPAADDEEPV